MHVLSNDDIKINSAMYIPKSLMLGLSKCYIFPSLKTYLGYSFVDWEHDCIVTICEGF